jgi:hypothetical protein
MGRRTKFPEKKLCAFAEGTLAAIDRACAKTEDSTDLIREAVDRELRRRGGVRKVEADQK